jgi:GTP-binding protein
MTWNLMHMAKLLKEKGIPAYGNQFAEWQKGVRFDFTKAEQQYEILKGGRGGLGNSHFKSSINQAPSRNTTGHPGEETWARLALKLLSDAGLVGLPNAGKSTFLSRVSGAKPKIADYPFTTLSPHLGVVYNDEDEFVLADIPGIIEGAAEGKGLGHYFLRHIERNSTLLFLVPADADDIKKEYEILLDELRRYNPEMLDKDRLVVISKCDMLDEELKTELKKQLDKEFKGTPYLFISSVAQQGLSELKDKLWQMLNVEVQ